MTYVHFYPQGAIQTVEQLFAAYDQQAFKVYGLGVHSFLQEVTVPAMIYNGGIDCWFGGDRFGDRIASGDLNIGKHHNEHYLFLNRADAEAYLAYAKTQPQHHRPYDWES